MWFVVGAVVIVLALRSRQAGAAADPCDQLEGEARLACKLGRWGLGQVYEGLRDAVQTEDRGEDNVRLNGPVTEYWDTPGPGDDLYRAASGDFGRAPPTRYTDAARGPAGERRPKRHANGCAPFPAHPDWSKCAPGTKSMETAVGAQYARAGRGELDARSHGFGVYPAVAPRPGVTSNGVAGGDAQRDALTFPWSQRLSPVSSRAGEPNRELAFPLEVPAGATAWVVRGEPVVCPPGTEVVGRDHRTGSETRSPCSVRQQVNPPPTVSDDEPGGDDCLRYYLPDGTSRRDCREDATLPPGASTTPPLGKTGTARIAGVSSSGFRV